MNRCATCKGKLQKTTRLESIEVGGSTFTAQVSAMVCVECDQIFFNGPELELFELRAAVEIAKAGVTSGEAMRFMRKVLGMRAKDLAELLDVSPETLSRWETGAMTIPRQVMALLDSLVRERAEGRTTTMDSLQAVREPKALGRKVSLALDSRA